MKGERELTINTKLMGKTKSKTSEVDKRVRIMKTSKGRKTKEQWREREKEDKTKTHEVDGKRMG